MQVSIRKHQIESFYNPQGLTLPTKNSYEGELIKEDC